MKEVRFFYTPDIAGSDELPEEEAQHALRVLRLKEGDEMMLMDGVGSFYRAEVTEATQHRCHYKIVETLPQEPAWRGELHLAIAPTKMMERIEWMVEKATEVGFDHLSLLDCKFSERRQVKTARLERIAIAAMKQSRKAWKPVVEEMRSFSQFMQHQRNGRCFIAHCYEEVERHNLFDLLRQQPISGDEEVTVLVGPEGDFSIDEVQQAVAAGYVSVSLGTSRLRTETAGLAAVMMMHLSQQIY